MYQNTQHLANSKRKEMIEFVCINSCITLSLPNRQEQQPATLLRYNSSSFPNKTKSKSRTKQDGEAWTIRVAWRPGGRWLLTAHGESWGGTGSPGGGRGRPRRHTPLRHGTKLRRPQSLWVASAQRSARPSPSSATCTTSAWTEKLLRWTNWIEYMHERYRNKDNI